MDRTSSTDKRVLIYALYCDITQRVVVRAQKSADLTYFARRSLKSRNRRVVSPPHNEQIASKSQTDSYTTDTGENMAGVRCRGYEQVELCIHSIIFFMMVLK